jgi:DNA-directed RNA polymerase subunit M/transcription elongation factor TFIIS
MILDELRSMTEEQMATSNMIKLTAESMRSLVEQHDKISTMIKIIMNQLMDNGVEEIGTTNGYKELGKLEGEDHQSNASDPLKHVLGKCIKCKADFMGIPQSRDGGNASKTHFKTCKACHKLWLKKVTSQIH